MHSIELATLFMQPHHNNYIPLLPHSLHVCFCLLITLMTPPLVMVVEVLYNRVQLDIVCL